VSAGDWIALASAIGAVIVAVVALWQARIAREQARSARVAADAASRQAAAAEAQVNISRSRLEAEMDAQRELIQSLAKTIFIVRKGKKALIRNEGDKRIRDVVVEAGVDREKAVVSPDFIEENVINARIPLGDLLPKTQGEADLIGWSGAYKDQEGGPWTRAEVVLKPRPPPFLPSELTSEKADAMIAKASILSVTGANLAQRTFEDDHARRRAVYELLWPKTADVSNALVDLSVCFTDFNERRWRRREDGTVEALAG
jgi:hypothetical protein